MSKTEAMLTLSNRRVEMLERLYIEMIRERSKWKSVAIKLADAYLKALEQTGENPDEDEIMQEFADLMRYE